MQCFFNASSRLEDLAKSQIRALSTRIQPPGKIVLKPNWVLHETNPAFPIQALITDPRIIDAVLLACLDIFPTAESILVADCPLQYADWGKLAQQSGLNQVIEKYKAIAPHKVRFADIRREVFAQDGSTFLNTVAASSGDPRGYREVNLASNSHLSEIASQWKSFAVNDYSNDTTSSNHRPGSHKYLVSQSVLDAHLLINLPKWKSHCKTGITCALKNLVGINGDKAYLPHFRKGAPKWGGDEFTDEFRWLYLAQTRLREKLQKKNRLAFRFLKPGWEILKRLYGIETKLTQSNLKPKNFYVGGGGWHGNDTVWRMVYDLNYVVQCMDSTGTLRKTQQRDYFSIVDGLVSGEGNGPLQPLPRETNFVAFGNNPFLIDLALAWLMGFDPAKIPLLSRRKEYLGPDWGKFLHPMIEIDGVPTNVFDSGINLRFVPPPGWRNQIER